MEIQSYWHLIVFMKDCSIGTILSRKQQSSQIQVWRIHYLKTFRGRRGGGMMDVPINHWWRQNRDRFLVQEGIMSNEFKLTIHKAMQISKPPVWSFPVSLYKYTISSHTFWITQFYHKKANCRKKIIKTHAHKQFNN